MICVPPPARERRFNSSSACKIMSSASRNTSAKIAFTAVTRSWMAARSSTMSAASCISIGTVMPVTSGKRTIARSFVRSAGESSGSTGSGGLECSKVVRVPIRNAPSADPLLRVGFVYVNGNLGASRPDALCVFNTSSWLKTNNAEFFAPTKDMAEDAIIRTNVAWHRNVERFHLIADVVDRHAPVLLNESQSVAAKHLDILGMIHLPMLAYALEFG